jgi:hypothetical protein
MTDVSKSPQRHTFQKEGYVKRQAEKGEPVNDDYLDLFEKILDEHDHKFDDPKSRINNMEYDLLTTDWILEKVRASESYAQNLYAAMCNNDFIKIDVIPILRQDPEKDYWGASWRYAGGIVADMRGEGDYMDWYCSGIRGGVSESELAAMTVEQQERYHWYEKNFVSESVVTDEIRADLLKLGWLVVDSNSDDI